MEEWLKTGTMLSIYPTYLTSTKLALPFILKLLQSHPGALDCYILVFMGMPVSLVLATV